MRPASPARLAPILGLLLVTGVAPGGCQDFLAVDNPMLIEGSDVDELDAATFARSAHQNLATAYARLLVYSAWFTGEAVLAETMAEPHEFGRRDISADNQALLRDIWTPLSVARASGDRLLAGLDGTGPRTDLARSYAALVAGFAMILIGEHFCHGAIDAGPSLTPAMVADTAIQRLAFAQAAAQRAEAGSTGAEADEARAVALAARVGRARAHLQVGRRAEAAAEAAGVPVDFTYELPYSDDLNHRLRLGNFVWHRTVGRGILAIAPAFRDLADPRVPVLAPRPDRPPFDGITEFWTQDKYPSYGASIRLASGLEATYLAAEAEGGGALLALIQSRRQANEQEPWAGPHDDASLFEELLEQRRREFFLEGRRLGDWRRHPDAIRFVPQPGSEYPRAGHGPIGEQTCFPLPAKETRNNPNI